MVKVLLFKRYVRYLPIHLHKYTHMHTQVLHDMDVYCVRNNLDSSIESKHFASTCCHSSLHNANGHEEHEGHEEGDSTSAQCHEGHEQGSCFFYYGFAREIGFVEVRLNLKNRP